MPDRSPLPADPACLVWCSFLVGAVMGQAGAATAQTRSLVPQSGPVSLYINYSAMPDAAAVLAHGISVLDPDAGGVPFAEAEARGRRLLAYVSAVEMSPGSAPARLATARGIPTAAANPNWNTQALEVTHPAWQDWLVQDAVGSALARGYHGVFLDTLDSVMLGDCPPGQVQARWQALAAALRHLRREHPHCHVVLNRGFALLKDCAPLIDGVLIESLYQTWSPQQKAYAPVAPADTQWLLDRITEIKARRLPLFIVDYVPPDQADLARQTTERIRAIGGVPFITTPELMGHVFTPPRGGAALPGPVKVIATGYPAVQGGGGSSPRR